MGRAVATILGAASLRRSISRVVFPAVAILVVAACATPATQRDSTISGSSASQDATRSAANRSLTVAFRYELTSMSPKTAQAASGQMQQLFNAGLAIFDGRGESHAQLAAALPKLDTDTWRVLPDGKMETTYALRPNGTWHDGQPLTADDFVFAWQVYTDAGLGFSAKPQDQIEEIVAVDSRTVMMRWKSLYPDAGELAFDFVPLPKPILEPSFAAYRQSGDAQAFLNQAYWTTAFVGVGPYRLLSWEPGAQLEAAAFEGYALGKPNIARLIVKIVGDENTTLASIMADQIELAMENTMRFEHALTLKQDWVPVSRGVVGIRTSNVITNVVQFRPEFQKEPGMMDKRVRQAMAWAIDKQSLQEGLYAGEGNIAVAAMSSDDRFYPEVDRRVNRYAYDPRRSEQLMTDAGYAKDREGYFALPNGDRFRPEFQVLAGTTFERGQAIITDGWWKAGIQVQPAVMSAVQVRDNQARATFPGIGMLLVGVGAQDTFTTSTIGTAANRWSGGNRGGWSSPEYDQTYVAFNTALNRSDRSNLAVQLMNLVNEEVPGFPMYFDVKVLAYIAKLTGPDHGNPLWNIHTWQMS